MRTAWPGIFASAQPAVVFEPDSLVGFTLYDESTYGAHALYPFMGGFGFGTRYARGGANAFWGETGSFKADGTAFAFGYNGTPRYRIYPFNQETGIGTAYAQAATPPEGYVVVPRWSSAATRIVMGHNTSPRLSAYVWDNTTGIGTKAAAPTVPGSTVYGFGFDSGNANVLCNTAASTLTAALYACAWSGTALGTKRADAAAPAGNTYWTGDVLKKDGTTTYVYPMQNADPRLGAIPFASNAWGAHYAAPSTIPNPSNKALPREDGAFIGLYANRTTDNRGQVYAWSDGFGVRLADPNPGGWNDANNPANGGGLRWTPDGGHVVIAGAVGDTGAWVFADNTWGVRLAGPAEDPPSFSAPFFDMIPWAA